MVPVRSPDPFLGAHVLLPCPQPLSCERGYTANAITSDIQPYFRFCLKSTSGKLQSESAIRDRDLGGGCNLSRLVIPEKAKRFRVNEDHISDSGGDGGVCANSLLCRQSLGSELIDPATFTSVRALRQT